MVCRYEPFHVDGGARSIGSLDGQAAHASIIAGVVLPGISTDACVHAVISIGDNTTAAGHRQVSAVHRTGGIHFARHLEVTIFW
jgi:hypothetical protein